MGKEPVRRGIELPKRADFSTLPAAHRGARLARRPRRSQAVSAGETADGGRIHGQAEAARHLAGGKAVVRRRSRAEEPAQERLDGGGPGPGMIATRSARLPPVLRARDAGAEIIGVELVKAGAPDCQRRSRSRGCEPACTEGGEDFADQRSAETVDELLIVFFTPRTMPDGGAGRQARSARQRPVLGPSLRSGPRTGRCLAECSRLLASNCPRLRARCSRLLATRQWRRAGLP